MVLGAKQLGKWIETTKIKIKAKDEGGNILEAKLLVIPTPNKHYPGPYKITKKHRIYRKALSNTKKAPRKHIDSGYMFEPPH